ncbi:MAG: nucleotide sugar dehydrogenase [Chlamydiota bacterium]|nr:nucleotide sugar dehydrogenase [Chlamydiota bacterium]
MSLDDKIRSKTAKIGVMGLGYVGLPLAVSFAEAGFSVLGFDVVADKVQKINQGSSYILDIPTERLGALTQKKLLRASSNPDDLHDLDCVSICVPTPLRKTRDPDISFIVNSVEALARFLHKDQLIVLESTTYPGTTEEVVLPLFEAKGLKVGRDFNLAFSPERVDPANKRYETGNIPKVIGGVTPACTKIAALLYGCVVKEVVQVSTSRVAEMVKLLENTFRAVNIGMVNELALLCHKMDIDVWEVIDGAATKPFGFMPFYPGPGLGGHCLPIDPIYLSWKARLVDFEARFIDLAAQVNRYMPHYVAEVVGEALNRVKKPINGSKILLLGVAYKKNVNDVRESPSMDIWETLKKDGADLFYHDPYIPEIHDPLKISSVPIDNDFLKQMDCVVLVTDHDIFDYENILEHSCLFVDTRNATKHIKNNRHKIVKI